MDPADPLKIARVLAARYPAQPIMSYIPALAWSGSLRLSELTGEAQWREKALKEMQSLHQRPDAGHCRAVPSNQPGRCARLFRRGYARARMRTLAPWRRKSAPFIMPTAPAGTYRFATYWTDDMFMVSSVLSRAGNEAWASRRRSASC